VTVSVVVLTYQAVSTGRVGLLENTLASLQDADYLQVVDNGSTDGTRQLVESWGGVSHDGPLHTSGHGNNLQARIHFGAGRDLCVFSDDDMTWRPDWREKLEAWWSEAPDDLAMAGCHIEPAYHWNTILDRVEHGGVPGLIRHSTGGASWSMPYRMLDVFFRPAGIWQQNQGYGDVMACDRLRERGYRIGQIDLAEHAGQGMSTWGNATESRYGWDIQPVLDILEGRTECTRSPSV
jgi:glycosyltransferase involved in cell wall biosynthesis